MLVEDLKNKALKIMEIRSQIKELNDKKDLLEKEFETSVREAYPTEKTVLLEDISATLNPTISYNLNDEGLVKLKSMYDYDTEYWENKPVMAEVKKLGIFDSYIVDKVGKTKIILKESKNKETLKG